MYHNFIHSSVDGRLGCFHVLVVVNSPAMNTWAHVSFSTMVFFSVFFISVIALLIAYSLILQTPC